MNINVSYSAEYAKSNNARCRTCLQKIEKGTLRMGVVKQAPDYDGLTTNWYHLECFFNTEVTILNVTEIGSFVNLRFDDQEKIKEKIGKASAAESLVAKEDRGDNSEFSVEHTESSLTSLQIQDEEYKNQNKLYFDMKDKLNAMSKKEMHNLLQHNKQHIPSGESEIRNNLADCLVFGAIKVCPQCKKSTPYFKIDMYKCFGDLSSYNKCSFSTKNPEREEFEIPSKFKDKFEFLKEYKYEKRDRLLQERLAAAEENPLKNFVFAVFGELLPDKNAVEKKLMELGGSLSSVVNNSVHICITTEDEVANDGSNVKLARHLKIHVVLPKFLEDIKNGITLVDSVKKNLICSWGEDPVLKFGTRQLFAKSQTYGYNSIKSDFQKINVINETAVDPQSGLQDKCCVYVARDNVYSTVLDKVDMSSGKNSYYKMQILEDKEDQKFSLFRSWGRVGQEIGNFMIENKNSSEDAVKEFEKIYFEKTGYEWKNRMNFIKKDGLYFEVETDYTQPEQKKLEVSSDCPLSKDVQELVCLIFDTTNMKNAMIEFQIDLGKMPLGKISRDQIEKAYGVLNEAEQIIGAGCDPQKILEASAKFYTLIPHDCGLNQPPLLNNKEIIKSKIEMLDSLLEIDHAYKMLNTNAKDPVFEYYKKLKTDIEVLDNSSDEYKIIEKYVENTHGETHNIKLTLNRVFKINRHGESDRYRKDLHNKKLLWHGSRLTNFVGILSQGLRIAPSHVPSTGTMFGKGVYFADMVSKSSQYCTKENFTSLLLLCEVALGNMYEKTSSEEIKNLPSGKHSTKGLGWFIPNPNETTTIDDAEVPYGKPIESNIIDGVLLYNEYIVYNVNQVNIKYLLEVTNNKRSMHNE